jgi:hypothetical protein
MICRDSDYALISVADTGTELTNKSLENIFNHFTRQGSRHGDRPWAVHGPRYRQAAQWFILVDSSWVKGRHSTFTCRYSAVTISNRKKSRRLPPAENLLVVEDEEIVRTFIRKILEGPATR